MPEAELVRALGEAGLEDVTIVANFDCLQNTSKEKVARKFGVRGVNIYAQKSGGSRG